MLYLLRSHQNSKKKLLKIGYTDNIQARYQQYKSANPGIELIGTREGDLFLETLLHFYLRSHPMKYPELSEWYYDCPEIRQLFHISESNLRRKIWEKRDNIFNFDYIRSINSNDYKIYTSLLEEHINSFSPYEVTVEEKTLKKIPSFSSCDQAYLRSHGDPRIELEDIDKGILDLVDNFLENHFYTTGVFAERLRMYCEFIDNQDESKKGELLSILDRRLGNKEFSTYYNICGTKRCRTKRFRRNELEKDIIFQMSTSSLKEMIESEFKRGNSYTKAEIKKKLSQIYSSLGLAKKAKATDLEEYFSVRRSSTSVKDPKTGKRVIKEVIRLK